MSIRILNHNGTAHQLSVHMTAAFQSELCRIGESPLQSTINLWITNQTPEELLEILKRMPGHTADDDGSGGNGTKVLPDCERPGQEEKDSNADSAAAPISTAHHDGVVERHQGGGTVSPGQVGTLPYTPTHTAGSNNRWKNRRVFNSAYQHETGHIFADPCGLGELEVRNGVIVNLRREAEREREIEERKVRDGGNAEGDEKGVVEG